jgi:hypothetical protein
VFLALIQKTQEDLPSQRRPTPIVDVSLALEPCVWLPGTPKEIHHAQAQCHELKYYRLGELGESGNEIAEGTELSIHRCAEQSASGFCIGQGLPDQELPLLFQRRLMQKLCPSKKSPHLQPAVNGLLVH